MLERRIWTLNSSDYEDGKASSNFDAWLSDGDDAASSIRRLMNEEVNVLFGGVTAEGAGVEEGKMDEPCTGIE